MLRANAGAVQTSGDAADRLHLTSLLLLLSSVYNSLPI